MNDVCKLPGGIFTLQVYEKPEDIEIGKVKEEKVIHNKMTNASLAVISGLVGNTGSQTAFGYVAVGTSSTAVSAAHTGLQSETVGSGLTRAATTNSRTTTTQTNDTLSMTKTFTASDTVAIEEVGIFNASSSGTMLCRSLTGTINVVSGNTLIVTYTWTAVGN